MISKGRGVSSRGKSMGGREIQGLTKILVDVIEAT